jgi:hypothetical protein
MKQTSASSSSLSDCCRFGFARAGGACPLSSASIAGALPFSGACPPRPPAPSLLPRPRPRLWKPPRPRPLPPKLSWPSSAPPFPPLLRPRPLPPLRCGLAGTCAFSWAPVEAIAGYRVWFQGCVQGIGGIESVEVFLGSDERRVIGRPARPRSTIGVWWWVGKSYLR